MAFDKSDPCTRETPPDPEEPKSMAVPEPRPGDETTLCINIHFFGNDNITLYETRWLYGDEGSCYDTKILCEDDKMNSTEYICNRTIFGRCTFDSNLCITNYTRNQSGNYITRACPVHTSGGPGGNTTTLELSKSHELKYSCFTLTLL